ncbi:chromosomal replication initiator protein DnaA [candidate division WWE3 bacterium]|nr:chromosomal replication initiator protein DnaA [candidate division WWE3 bacterium]
MDIKTLWKAVLSELQVVLSETQFKTWVQNTRADNLTENSIDVVCETAFAKKQLENLQSLIKSSVDKIGKGDYQIHIKIGKIKDVEKETEQNMGPLFQNDTQYQTDSINSKDQNRQTSEVSSANFKKAERFGLKASYTFSSYIMGSNNRLAFAIAKAVAENPGTKYNPFFLYAGVGLGKTHLIHAVGNEIIRSHPELNIGYTTGEAFTNELIESIQSGNRGGTYAANKFRNKYRSVDVLIIDDIQFIIGKESTQQEFFHTFNSLFLSQKQIIITSDRPPKNFTSLEDRITSRFSSGIIADITPPDLDTRIAILRTKRDTNHDNIPNETLDFVAEKVDTNIRELEGAYLQVVTQAKAMGESPTVEFAAHALGHGIVKEKSQKATNVNDIIKTVASYYAVKITDLKGKQRTKDLVIPRQMAMYLMYELTNTPYMTIGELLGGRDHTTVMHGVGKVKDDMENNFKTKQDAVNIKRTLTN